MEAKEGPADRGRRRSGRERVIIVFSLTQTASPQPLHCPTFKRATRSCLSEQCKGEHRKKMEEGDVEDLEKEMHG